MAKDSIHSIYSYYKYLGLGTYKERKKIMWLTVLYLAESREHVPHAGWHYNGGNIRKTGRQPEQGVSGSLIL